MFYLIFVGRTKFECDAADDWANYDFIENNVYGNWKLCVLHTICLSLEWSDNWISTNVMCDQIFMALWRVDAMWNMFYIGFSVSVSIVYFDILFCRTTDSQCLQQISIFIWIKFRVCSVHRVYVFFATCNSLAQLQIICVFVVQLIFLCLPFNAEQSRNSPQFFTSNWIRYWAATIDKKETVS